MNSFNRLLSLYIDLFIEKKLFDYNKKMRKVCVLKENAYICNVIKKREIMKTVKNFKITVLSVNDKIEQSFFTQSQAVDTIVQLKEIDEGFLAGILEKINGGWYVVWSLK